MPPTSPGRPSLAGRPASLAVLLAVVLGLLGLAGGARAAATPARAGAATTRDRDGDGRLDAVDVVVRARHPRAWLAAHRPRVRGFRVVATSVRRSAGRADARVLLAERGGTDTGSRPHLVLGRSGRGAHARRLARDGAAPVLGAARLERRRRGFRVVLGWSEAVALRAQRRAPRLFDAHGHRLRVRVLRFKGRHRRVVLVTQGTRRPAWLAAGRRGWVCDGARHPNRRSPAIPLHEGATSPAGGDQAPATAPGAPASESPSAAPYPAVAPVLARGTAAFLDSMGVNTHLYFGNSTSYDFPRVRARLDQLGVPWIRDGSCGGCDEHTRRLTALAQDGIRSQLILGDPRQSTAWLDLQVKVISERLRGVVGAVEGANEYDITGDPAWIPRLRTWQQEIWSRMKGDPALAGIPVVGPSLVNHDSRAQLGDITPWVDLGNMHPYPAGRPPTEGHQLDELALAALNSGTKPVVASETGYHNALSLPLGRWQPPVTERVAALYWPRMYFEDFRQRIERTFAYELVDMYPDATGADQEQHFGLLRNDLSPKPAFTAISNLTALLKLGGATSSIGALRVRVDGGADVHSSLLRGSGGSYLLAVWREISAWDQDARRDLTVAPTAVTITLGQAMGRAQVYVPTTSASPILTFVAPREVALPIGAAAAIVRFTP